MKREDLLRAAREALRETAPDRFDELSPLLDLPATGETAAAHATIAEATLVTAIETLFKAHLGEVADDAIQRFARKRAESRVYQTFLFGTMSTADRVDGKGTCSKRLALPCPACQQTSCVDYVGSDVIEGSLEWVHVMHTEVEDWFICSKCQFSWSENQFI